MPVRLFLNLLKRVGLWLVLVAAALLAIRAYNSWGGPPLRPWHTYAPVEMTVAELDRASWADYLKSEDRIFEGVRSEVTAKLEPEDRVASNRYFEGSPLYPGHFSQDWNRSYILEPGGKPAGAVVLLHGLTDCPYSLRHLAANYRARGFVAVAIRLPGHGTVPGGLTDVDWPQWLAATRLAVREARRRIGPGDPLELVGFSNGGALALMVALDALDDPSLPRPDRLVLISPMVGITGFARFAGLAGLPAILPSFAKAAWLGVLPEFNPFKYNSFPVNGARQSCRLTNAIQDRILRLARDGGLARLPPVLTFQSILDSTVSTRAVVSDLYDQLPRNGSELVLFDLNRNAKLGPLFRPSADTALTRILPPSPRNYRATIIADSPGNPEVIERVTESGDTVWRSRPLGLTYPSDVFSLSHVALPFPASDSLYGSDPDPADDFGVNLGALAPRGESHSLIVNLDTLLRASCNPFFPYLLERVSETPKAR